MIKIPAEAETEIKNIKVKGIKNAKQIIINYAFITYMHIDYCKLA